MDGYQQSVKAVMRAAGGGRLQGVIGPVAGILTVEKGLRDRHRDRTRLCAAEHRGRGSGLCPRRHQLFEG